MKPIRLALAIACLLCIPNYGQAQRFDDYFEDRTLRLDYIFAGDNQTQDIYFEQAFVTPRWAGRKARLSEMPLRGNGQLTVKDSATGEVLFVHTFSTLFQEWQTTEEATRVRKAFETSYNVPFPRQNVDVTITLRDFHNRVVAQLTHSIDPKDILIRPISDNGIPYHYIWKGGDSLATQESYDKAGDRKFMPTPMEERTELDITGCIDIAIMAEGYTEQQMGKFYSDCQRVADALFAHEPFSSLKRFFNIVAVATPSQESGPSVPHLEHWRQTAVGTHYDTFYSDRYLMSQEMHRIYNLLSGVPFEHIIVLVNSDTYGGGGIYNQLTVTTSDHPTFKQVLVHEFGHSYGGLGDEYYYDDAYETMYPADTEPWEPNLTTLVNFASKWADMLPKGTSIPTPPIQLPDYRNIHTEAERRQLNEATQRVGVFEGGGYQSKGVFRPCQECRMKINEVENFCPVCSRAIQRITEFYTSR